MGKPAPPPTWRDHLDAAMGAVMRLDQTAIKISQSEAGEIAKVLRSLNRQIWGIVNTLEAGHLEHLYNVDGLIRDIARLERISVGEAWIELTESGALSVRTAALIRSASKLGLKVEDYLQLPGPEGEEE